MTAILSTTAEWVTRLANDERRRDEVQLRAKQAVDRRTDLVSQHGRRMLDELRTTVVRDVDGSESNSWGVTGYPETFFVDASGKVIPPHVNGPIPADRLNAAIRQALRS